MTKVRRIQKKTDLYHRRRFAYSSATRTARAMKLVPFKRKMKSESERGGVPEPSDGSFMVKIEFTFELGEKVCENAEMAL